MLYFFYGSDRDKARQAMSLIVEKVSKNCDVARVTDAHTVNDLRSTLQGPGMFGKERIVVLDNILGGENTSMIQILLESLEILRGSEEKFFMIEGGLDALTRKQVEKYAEKSEKFDAPKKEKDNSIFTLANALQKGDRKSLWVGLMQEFAKGSAPEAVHGLLFWGAKQMVMKSRSVEEIAQTQKLVAALVELPHEARRRGEDLEYALERFVLSKRDQ